MLWAENQAVNNVTVFIQVAGANGNPVTLPFGSTVADFLTEWGFSTAADVRYNNQPINLKARPEGWETLVIMTNKITQG